MRSVLVLAIVLTMAVPASAETYSWVDDNGTWNFTEEMSRVPVKYRKNVKRLGDTGSDPVSQESAPPEKKIEPVGTPVEKTSPVPVDDKHLYDGKSSEAWRLEFESQEAGLKILEQQMDSLQKQSLKQSDLSPEQSAIIRRDFEDTKAKYDQQYKVYTELIESARRAGLTVEMKK